jgi:hypothetical protein
VYALECHACGCAQVPRLLATAPFDSGGQTGRLRTVTALQVRRTARQLAPRHARASPAPGLGWLQLANSSFTLLNGCIPRLRVSKISLGAANLKLKVYCRPCQICTTAGLLAVGHQQGDVRLFQFSSAGHDISQVRLACCCQLAGELTPQVQPRMSAAPSLHPAIFVMPVFRMQFNTMRRTGLCMHSTLCLVLGFQQAVPHGRPRPASLMPSAPSQASFSKGAAPAFSAVRQPPGWQCLLHAALLDGDVAALALAPAQRLLAAGDAKGHVVVLDLAQVRNPRHDTTESLPLMIQACWRWLLHDSDRAACFPDAAGGTLGGRPGGGSHRSPSAGPAPGAAQPQAQQQQQQQRRRPRRDQVSLLPAGRRLAPGSRLAAMCHALAAGHGSPLKDRLPLAAGLHCS